MTGHPLRVTVLEEVPVDPQIIAAWNELAMRMERPEVFYVQQWALAASVAFAGRNSNSNVRPLIFLVYDSDRLCGVAALATPRESRHTAFFLTASTADYCDILSEAPLRKPVLVAIFDELRKLRVSDLALANVPSDSATLRELPATAASRGFHVHARAAYDCGVIILGSEQERQTVLKTVRRKERENRGLKKMSQMGQVETTHIVSEPTDADLMAIVSAQISRFLATQRISPLVQPERRLFLAELARLLGPAGWLKISRLEVNGEPVAWNYGFRFGDSWFWYLPTFQIRYEQFSPGSCLLQLLIQQGCAEPSVNRLDLGLGDEAYKARFANSANPTSYVEISASSLRHETNVGRHWLASRVKKSPKLEQKLRTTRDRLISLRGRVRETGLAATAGYALRRASHQLVSDDEVLLFEAPTGVGVPDNALAGHDRRDLKMSENSATLCPLEWKHLTDAAILHADDSRTLQYLMRSAERLRRGGEPGYVLQTQDSPSAHFLWIANFAGFHLSEIDYKLGSADADVGAVASALEAGVAKPCAPEAAMIFDCWTPAVHRGKGYYAIAIRLAAACLEQQLRPAWIFSAAANESSTRGIIKAGFLYRYSLVRTRRGLHSSVAQRYGTSVPIGDDASGDHSHKEKEARRA